MKTPTFKIAAALLGGIAVVTGLAAVWVAAFAGVASPLGELPAWSVPLVAGGGVGLLSWLLLTSSSAVDEDRDVRVVTPCSECGSDVLDDWRICPYCGGTTKSGSADQGRVTRTA